MTVNSLIKGLGSIPLRERPSEHGVDGCSRLDPVNRRIRLKVGYRQQLNRTGFAGGWFVRVTPP